MKKLLLITPLYLLLFLGSSLTSLAQQVDPPIEPGDSDKTASVLRTSSAVSVVFHVDTDAAEVELIEPVNGKQAYKISGAVCCNQQVNIYSEMLPRSWYLVRVRVNKQIVIEQLIDIQ